MSNVPALPNDPYVDFKGWRFRAPFRCICCGQKVDIRQFCFGRACDICDTGKCKHRNNGVRRCYSGPRELIDPEDKYFILPERWLNAPEGLDGKGENPYPPKEVVPIPDPIRL